jgi:hypothetical protein
MPYSGNSSESISVVPLKTSSAWPIRPPGSLKAELLLGSEGLLVELDGPGRVLSLFAAAAGTGRRPLAVRLLRKAVQTLNGSIHLVASSRRRTVSAGCAAALKGDLLDTRVRATRLLATSPRR